MEVMKEPLKEVKLIEKEKKIISNSIDSNDISELIASHRLLKMKLDKVNNKLKLKKQVLENIINNWEE